MIDLNSKRIFLFDLDDTLINTSLAKEAGLKRAYQKLVSECVADFEKLPSEEEFKSDLTYIYRTSKEENGDRFFDYDAKVFEDYCKSDSIKALKLSHREFSLAARLCWHYRQTKNNSLMALPGGIEILKKLGRNCKVHVITEGKCNYQHTKAMLTDIEKDVDLVFVTKDKVSQLTEFINEIKQDKKLCVIIGDNETDIKAGKEAGIDTILVKTGKRDYNKFKTEADLTIVDLNEILKLLSE
ncbi:MAG: HAD hydrolase-like protein [Candidatus Micrarchaeota archaeon]